MTGKARSHELGFRPDLQGLRAIAVLLVVLDHAGFSAFSGGFVGVDIFFVLSGYLITALLLRQLNATGRIHLLEFYARRLRRLLPALAVMLAGTFGLAVWLLSSFEAEAQLRSGAYAATWTSNIYFVFAQIDYFDDLAARDLFLHTWSLGVEEQFYLVWPVLLICFFNLGRRLRGDTDQGIFWGLVAIATSSFLLSLYWSFASPRAAFFMMLARMWQFALGGLLLFICRTRVLAALPANPHPRASPLVRAILGTGLALILFSAIYLDKTVAYPGLWALMPSIGAALTIVAGSLHARGTRGLLTHRGLVWLGDRSYSLYLWHWPVLILGLSLGVEEESVQTVSLVLCALLFAIFSYRYVELPFWKGGVMDRPLERVLLSGALVMLTLVAVSVHVDRLMHTRVIAERPPGFSKITVPEIYRKSCDAWIAHARVEPCVFGPADAPRTVVLLGDSIGVQWFSAVPEIFRAPEWRTVVLTKSSCPMVDEDFFYTRIGAIYEVCAEWREGVLNWLDRERPDVLIFGSFAGYEFSAEQWHEGTRRILDRVSEAADSVILIPGTPSLGFHGPGCLMRGDPSRHELLLDRCKAQGRTALVRPNERLLEQAAEPYANVHFANFNDLVCPDDVCAAMSETGILVFRDNQHLNDSFVKMWVPVLRQRLVDHLGESNVSTSR
ncbi:acyltransferase family protein [Thioalkalivibrio sp. XN279]|uniref:acyltransferase family protein n=1 Tax=Thioalkalivibrio sp. XN279 TaxID=2714953 RepID=UPI00140CF040|nr:acyltransferase family protein [Thioalkalivibrio sp. XN279]NHA16060.1 acyltransferase [Thioalkalivibrio sp. XN279]